MSKNLGSFRTPKKKSPLTIIQFLSQNTQKQKHPLLSTIMHVHLSVHHRALNLMLFSLVLHLQTWVNHHMPSVPHTVEPCFLCIRTYVCVFHVLSGLGDLGFKTLHSKSHSHSHRNADGLPWSDQQICRCHCSSSRTTQRRRSPPAPSIRNLHKFAKH